MAYFPDKSTPDMSNPYGTIQYPQPAQTKATGNKQTINGQDLLNAKAPGKMNENRFSSLKPRRNDK